MDYKEEYQKALERAKKGLPIDEVFPELKESEDERIRKELVEYFSRTGCNFIRGIPIERIMAYLEKQKDREKIVPEREATDFEIEVHEIIAQARSDKRLADKDVLEQFEKEAACALMWKAEKQKEQKPAEWSEEDEKIFNSLCTVLHGGLSSIPTEKFISWLKSRLSRPQKEWSEEDEYKVDDICKLIEHATIIPRSGNDDTGIPPTRLNDKYKGELKAFIKSIRNLPKISDTWKPSEEQMKALERAEDYLIESDNEDAEIIGNLYNDLEKQMEE